MENLALFHYDSWVEILSESSFSTKQILRLVSKWFKGLVDADPKYRFCMQEVKWQLSIHPSTPAVLFELLERAMIYQNRKLLSIILSKCQYKPRMWEHALTYLIQCNDYPFVKCVYEKYSVNITTLMIIQAVRHAEIRIVRYLMERIDPRRFDHDLALSKALRGGKERVIAYVINQVISHRPMIRFKKTLKEATRRGYFDLVDAIVEGKIGCYRPLDANCVLQGASYSCDMTKLEKAISLGAWRWDMAMIGAARMGFVSRFKDFYSMATRAGIESLEWKRSAYAAIKGGHLEMLIVVVHLASEVKEDLPIEDLTYFASNQGEEQIVRFLIQGRSQIAPLALTYATGIIDYNEVISPPLVSFLLNEMQTNTLPCNWVAHLQGAAKLGSLELVKIFEKKVSPSSITDAYKQAIQSATEYGHYEVVSYLKERMN